MGVGTLVDAEFLLTAAHVAEKLSVGQEVSVGDEFRQVESVWLHPSWSNRLDSIYSDSRLGFADVALVQLTRPVGSVMPVPICEQAVGRGPVVSLVGNGAFGTGLTGGVDSDSLWRRVTSRIEDMHGEYWLSIRFDEPRLGTELEGVPSSRLEFLILIDSYFSKSVLVAEGADVLCLVRRLRAVMLAFSAELSSLGVEAVRMPVSVGGWSPLQIAAHLMLSNELLSRAADRVAGGGTVLELPKGSLTSRGTMIAHDSTIPADYSGDVEQALDSLVTSSEELIARVQRAVHADVAECVCFVNPYFGALSAAECLQLAVVHVVHHQRQLPIAAG